MNKGQAMIAMAATMAVGVVGPEMSEMPYAVTNAGYGPPSGTRPSGKVRDTKPAPKPRKRERRSARHTQRRK